MTTDIKSMQLYPRAERILTDLRALGYTDDMPVSVDVLNRFDQLHYHGTDALDAAISDTGMKTDDQVLEVGSGWGGCARYLAQRAGANLTAVELQEDYHRIAQNLTARAGLGSAVTHVNADFLALNLPDTRFDRVVSWLALFHIPDRSRYLSKIHAALKPGGTFFAEDLFLITPPAPDEIDDFRAHLFPNSLVDHETYHSTLRDAGFTIIESTDMTADWTAFTADRLVSFRKAQAAYEAIHGKDGFDIIETFYSKMSGYFQRGLVGGLRFTAKRNV